MQAIAPAASQPSGTERNFTYDSIYELTQVTQGSSTTESYSYDPVGNRLSLARSLFVYEQLVERADLDFEHNLYV